MVETHALPSGTGLPSLRRVASMAAYHPTLELAARKKAGPVPAALPDPNTSRRFHPHRARNKTAAWSHSAELELTTTTTATTPARAAVSRVAQSSAPGKG